MRLWHHDLMPYLPKSQLIAQWRELNSIYKKQDNHILIDYIYQYMNCKRALLEYSVIVINEINRRGYKIKKWENFDNFNQSQLSELIVKSLKDGLVVNTKNINGFYYIGYYEHDNKYLEICFYNLKEKYIRGQKDFSKEQYQELENFVMMKLWQVENGGNE